MAFKPNYGQQRMERDRIKRAKKEEKLRLQREEVERRKSGGEDEAASDKHEDT